MTSRRLLDPVSKVLFDAADYIEKHGHAKNALRRPSQQVCILGAMNMVTIGREHGGYDNYLIIKARHKLKEYLGDSELFLNDWNNADERTADEVIAALRGAAIA